MTRKRHFSILSLVVLLLMAAIACQVGTPTPEASIDRESIIRDAVATVQASMPAAATSVATVPNVATAPISFDLQTTLVDVYRRVNPSVVHIFVFSRSFDLPLGSGSGFVYDTDGHIVTNNHVVMEGDDFEVVFADGSRSSATLVGTDVDSDLAVLKVDSLPGDASPVPLSDSSSLVVGQFVVAIGNPFEETGSMSVGIISGLGRTLESQRAVAGGGRYSLPQVIQTDAAINPGNSGGPLLNLQGEVIGVNSSILTRSGANSGVGFSIPVNAVKRIAPALISDGEYLYPFIGISMNSQLGLDAQQELSLPTGKGVYVTGVTAGTPADEAGLVGNSGPGGDFIIAVDGNPVSDSSELLSYLVFETVVGQTIELTVIRDNQETIIPLTLGARP